MKSFFYLFCVTALIVAGMVFGRSVMGGGWTGIEFLLAALAVTAFMRWRSLARRRERQKLDAMRDSALW